jgi:hypothetical protein
MSLSSLKFVVRDPTVVVFALLGDPQLLLAYYPFTFFLAFAVFFFTAAQRLTAAFFAAAERSSGVIFAYRLATISEPMDLFSAMKGIITHVGMAARRAYMPT